MAAARWLWRAAGVGKVASSARPWPRGCCFATQPEGAAASVKPRPLAYGFGRLAKLADGSAVVSSGNTTVLAAVVSSRGASWTNSQGRVPLEVDYRERAAAAGRIPTSFLRRETRENEREMVVGLAIDRAVRPLFPGRYNLTTKLSVNLLSADGQIMPDVLAINAASAALMASDIPWAGPVAAVRVARVDRQWQVNPTFAEVDRASLQLLYVDSAAGPRLVELDSGRSALDAAAVVDALALATAEAAVELDAQRNRLAPQTRPKRIWTPADIVQEMITVALSTGGATYAELLDDTSLSKPTLVEALNAVTSQLRRRLRTAFPAASDSDIAWCLTELQRQAARASLLRQRRQDGRAFLDARTLTAEAPMLPDVVHGSALVACGSTQALATATLDALATAQTIDAFAGGAKTKRFFFHYEQPGFARNNTDWSQSMSDPAHVDNGNFAERALLPVMPSEDAFPFAVRVTSETLAADAGTATTALAAGSLALLDAGVPLSAPLAGVTAGIVVDATDANAASPAWHLLCDPTGHRARRGAGSKEHEEAAVDALLRLAGTPAGITVAQLVVQSPADVSAALPAALYKATAWLADVHAQLVGVMAAARPVPKPSAPRSCDVKIHPALRGTLIGPGGKQIKAIRDATGATIDVDDDSSTARIFARTVDGLEAAQRMVLDIAGDIEPGKVQDAVVQKLTDFGAFAQLVDYPSREAYVQTGDSRGLIKVGDRITVVVQSIDQRGKVTVRLNGTPAGTPSKGPGGRRGPEGGPASHRSRPPPHPRSSSR